MRFRIVIIEADGAEHVGSVLYDSVEEAVDVVGYIVRHTPPRDVEIQVRPILRVVA